MHIIYCQVNKNDMKIGLKSDFKPTLSSIHNWMWIIIELFISIISISMFETVTEFREYGISLLIYFTNIEFSYLL